MVDSLCTFLYQEAKRNPLTDEISRNLQLELKGLVAQQCTDIKHEIKSMCSNNHEKTIKDVEKEMRYLKGELSNTYQLISNFCNINSTCFLKVQSSKLKKH